VAIDSIDVHPANARRHPRRNLDAIRASLRQFGQQLPVVVNGEGLVVAGNGTLRAARELGWRQIAAVVTDQEGLAQQALAVAMNRTAELAEWDDGRLAAELEAIVRDLELADATGFSERDISGLLGKLADGEAAETAETAGIEPFEVREPPTMVWVLLGIPLEAWPMAMEAVTQLRALAGVDVETTR